MPNYTSLIFSVLKNKSGLFNKTQPKDETALSMPAWVGDFSQERNEDVELPDAAYHVDFASPTLTAVRAAAPSKCL